jgi:hypothetical protein
MGFGSTFSKGGFGSTLPLFKKVVQKLEPSSLT